MFISVSVSYSYLCHLFRLVVKQILILISCLVANVQVLFGGQLRGDLPFQKCKVALEAVEFSDCDQEGDVGSYFADIIAQMAQDVSSHFQAFTYNLLLLHFFFFIWKTIVTMHSFL